MEYIHFSVPFDPPAALAFPPPPPRASARPPLLRPLPPPRPAPHDGGLTNDFGNVASETSLVPVAGPPSMYAVWIMQPRLTQALAAASEAYSVLIFNVGKGCEKSGNGYLQFSDSIFCHCTTTPFPAATTVDQVVAASPNRPLLPCLHHRTHPEFPCPCFPFFLPPPPFFASLSILTHSDYGVPPAWTDACNGSACAQLW